MDKTISVSRLIGIVSVMAGVLTALADEAALLPPSMSKWIIIGALIANSITERLQGGKSSLKLGIAANEVTVPEIKQEVKEGKLS
jgi:hypothetical protein